MRSNSRRRDSDRSVRSGMRNKKGKRLSYQEKKSAWLRQPRYTKLVRETKREFDRRDARDGGNGHHRNSLHDSRRRDERMYSSDRKREQSQKSREDSQPRRMMGGMQGWNDSGAAQEEDYEAVNTRLQRQAGLTMKN